MTGSWLVSWRRGPVPAGVPVLLCLPQAGAGCGQYRSWQTSFGEAVSVLGVQLPGREERWSEPPADDFAAAVATICEALADRVPADAELRVYGHSFGGLLGYEVARTLTTRYGRRLGALVVAACRPPAMWVGAGKGLLDDPDALEALLLARGLGPGVLDEDSRSEMIELLRQDARLSLSYDFQGAAPLACPLEAWGGAGDETVTSEHLDAWLDYTAGPFRRRQFPGGHTFHSVHPEPVLAALRDLEGTYATLPGAAG